MLHEAEFWVGVAFVIFMAIAWKMGAFKSVLSGLDSRAKRIRAELDEARRLREEAAAVLADYQRRRGEAEREAEDLVASAREEAERIAREAHERMADFVTRRTAAAEAKIAQAEVQAQQQVRAAAADAAVRISEEVLREEMRAGAGQSLITSSLGEIRGKLNA
jgi:F-type H+-transporting ATPase subunit b